MVAAQAEEAAFWSAIAEALEDEVPRLIFADWLVERNDPRGTLFRERHYWRHLNADCRDPVQVVLGVLDAWPSGPSKWLLQAAAMVGAPLVPGCWSAAGLTNRLAMLGRPSCLAPCRPTACCRSFPT